MTNNERRINDEAQITRTVEMLIGFAGFGIRISFGLCHSGFVIYFGAHAIRPATTKMFASAISKKKSQPNRIS